jgi:hypothetical protein
MAKARQVGTPQSPQFVFGSSLKISIPVGDILPHSFQKLYLQQEETGILNTTSLA